MPLRKYGCKEQELIHNLWLHPSQARKIQPFPVNSSWFRRFCGTNHYGKETMPFKGKLPSVWRLFNLLDPYVVDEKGNTIGGYFFLPVWIPSIFLIERDYQSKGCLWCGYFRYYKLLPIDISVAWRTTIPDQADIFVDQTALIPLKRCILRII